MVCGRKTRVVYESYYNTLVVVVVVVAQAVPFTLTFAMVVVVVFDADERGGKEGVRTFPGLARVT
jgi:hypothetical protein